MSFDTHRLVVAYKVTYCGVDTVNFALEIDILEDVQHLDIFGVQLAIRRTQTKRPLTLGYEQVIVQPSVVSAEIVLGYNDTYGVQAYNYFSSSIAALRCRVNESLRTTCPKQTSRWRTSPQQA